MRCMMAVAAAALLLHCAIAVHAQQPAKQPYSEWSQVAKSSFPARASAVSAFFPPWEGHPSGRWLIVSGFQSSDQLESFVCLHDSWASEDMGVTWSELNAFVPLQRAEMGMDVIVDPTTRNATLLVTGGIDFVTAQSFNEVWESTDRGVSFHLVNVTMPWKARHGHGMVTVDHARNAIAILGGYSLDDRHANFFNDVWLSLDLGRTWTEMPLPPWSPRGDAAITADASGRVFVAGGYGVVMRNGQYDGLFNDVWMAGSDLQIWTQMTAAAAWWPRWQATLESINNTLVLLGGDRGGKDMQDTPPHPVSEIWMSWDNGQNWTWVANGSWSGRGDFESQVIGSTLLIAGGDDNTLLPLKNHVNNEVWATRLEADAPPQAPSPAQLPLPDAPTPTPVPDEHKKHKISTGALTAIIVGVLAVLGLLAYFCFRKANAKPAAPEGGYHLQE